MVKKITKSARQIRQALGQDPNKTRLLDAEVDEKGPHFAINEGVISPLTEVVLDFLGEPNGTLVRIEFDEVAQNADFIVE